MVMTIISKHLVIYPLPGGLGGFAESPAVEYILFARLNNCSRFAKIDPAASATLFGSDPSGDAYPFAS
jgi:hypothetical protein